MYNKNNIQIILIETLCFKCNKPIVAPMNILVYDKNKYLNYISHKNS